MAGGEGPSPHYYVFDLDETLGQMYSFFYQLCTLRPEEFFKNAMPPRHTAVLANNRTAAMRDRLGAAYGAFVRAIAEMESSEAPLGLLRPGILEVFQAIKAQKEQGRPVCAMIYSNNASLHSLELTRDVIHTALATDDLIRDCVHWHNPVRKPEIVPKNPGAARKTWPVLRRLLSEGPCAASPDVSPQQVTFFDDKVHPNLKATLGDDSIQVIPYEYKTPCSRVNTLYTKALRDAGFFDTEAQTQMLLDYIKKHCGTAKAPLIWENHLAYIVQLNGKTNAEASSPPARLADTDMLVAAVKKYDAPAINLGTNPLNVINTGVFTGGRGRIVRRRIITRRKRSKVNAKKSRHIRRRR